MCRQNLCSQGSLIQDVRSAVAENTSNGANVARSNVTPRGPDVTSQRAAAAAAANSRVELNTSTSSYSSRSSRDAAAKPPGNPTLFMYEKEFRTQQPLVRRL